MQVITGLEDRDKKQLTVAALAFALMTRPDHAGHTPEQCIDEAIALAPKILGLRGDDLPDLPDCPPCNL